MVEFLRNAGSRASHALVDESLADQAGLAAVSGTSGDMRDIESAAQAGDGRAALALDVFTTAVRDYVGAYLAELGGADALALKQGRLALSADGRRVVLVPVPAPCAAQ